MSEAFCTRCGAARIDPNASACTQCGTAFTTAFPLPFDEAPTRIGSARPAQPAQPVPPQQPAPQPPAQQQAQAPGGQQGWQQPPASTPQYSPSSPQHSPAPTGWSQSQQHAGGQPPYAPGPQAWGTQNQQPPRRSRTGLWVGLAAFVLVVGGVVTALVLTLGGDDDGGSGGGGGGENVASDEQQIEQVLAEYGEATNRLLQGDEAACDEVAALMVNLDATEVASCKENLEGPNYDGSSQIEYKYQDSTIDGDTAVVDVEMSMSVDNGTPRTQEDQLDMVKVDAEWKIDYDQPRLTD